MTETAHHIEVIDFKDRPLKPIAQYAQSPTQKRLVKLQKIEQLWEDWLLR